MINPFNPWFGVWNRDNLMKPKSKQNRKPDSNQLNIEGKKFKKNSKINPKKITRVNLNWWFTLRRKTDQIVSNIKKDV